MSDNSWEKMQENRGKALRQIMKFRCSRCNRSGGQVVITDSGVCQQCLDAEKALIEARPKTWGSF